MRLGTWNENKDEKKENIKNLHNYFLNKSIKY